LRHTVDVSTSTPVDREFAEEHMNIVLGRLAGPDARPRGDQVDDMNRVITTKPEQVNKQYKKQVVTTKNNIGPV
jgi:hypothetical protein